MHGITCRTPGCVNEGHTLVLSRPGHTVWCGACSAPITDIDPPIPEGGYPPHDEPEEPEDPEIDPDGEEE